MSKGHVDTYVFGGQIIAYSVRMWWIVWGNTFFKKEKGTRFKSQSLYNIDGDPYGTRTRVAGVRGRSPRPLDEGAE